MWRCISSCGNTAHGSGKMPSYSLKISTINSLHAKSGLRKRKTSMVYNKAMEKSRDGKHFGDFPRSKKQVIDLGASNSENKQAAGIDEVEALLGYNEELSDDGIVLYHSDVPFNSI